MVDKQSPASDTKKEEMYKRLRQLAFQKGPEAQMPTFKALCSEFATTRVTLGEALDLLEAEGIIYRKERLGIFVSPTIHRKSIQIVFNSNTFLGSAVSPFWGMLWLSIEQEIQRRKYSKNEQCTIQLLQAPVLSTEPLPESVLTLLSNKQTHGMLSVGIHMPYEAVVPDGAVPTVTFAASGPWAVILDGRTSGQQAVEVLKKQNCQRIGFWSPDHPTLKLEDHSEFHGIQQGLMEQQLPYYPELMRQFQQPPSRIKEPLSNQEQGYLLVHEVFRQATGQKPDGLFLGDDLLTDGALVAIEELGIQVGRELHIVTYANAGSPTLFGRTKNITIFEFDPHDIVQAMFASLDQLMSGGEKPPPFIWISPRQRP